MAKLIAVTDDGVYRSEEFKHIGMNFEGEFGPGSKRDFGDVVVEAYRKIHVIETYNKIPRVQVWKTSVKQIAAALNAHYGTRFSGSVTEVARGKIDLYDDGYSDLSDEEYISTKRVDPNEELYSNRSFIINVGKKTATIRDIEGRQIEMEPLGYAVLMNDALTDAGEKRSFWIHAGKPKFPKSRYQGGDGKGGMA